MVGRPRFFPFPEAAHFLSRKERTPRRASTRRKAIVWDSGCIGAIAIASWIFEYFFAGRTQLCVAPSVAETCGSMLVTVGSSPFSSYSPYSSSTSVFF